MNLQFYLDILLQNRREIKTASSWSYPCFHIVFIGSLKCCKLFKVQVTVLLRGCYNYVYGQAVVIAVFLIFHKPFFLKWLG